MSKTVIYAQSVYDLVVKKKQVDPFELQTAAKSFYKSVKAVGINNTSIRYEDLDKNMGSVCKKGQSIPLEMRAILAFVVRHYYRWDDFTMGRLEKHYGLPTTIQNILGNTGIFKKNGNILSLRCISVQDIINDYLS